MFFFRQFVIAAVLFLMFILIVSTGSVNAQSPDSEKAIGPWNNLRVFLHPSNVSITINDEDSNALAKTDYDTLPFVGFTIKGDC